MLKNMAVCSVHRGLTDHCLWQGCLLYTSIKKAFGKGKAFIPFITCGDPSLEVIERIVYAMEAVSYTHLLLQTELSKVFFRPFFRGLNPSGPATLNASTHLLIIV